MAAKAKSKAKASGGGNAPAKKKTVTKKKVARRSGQTTAMEEAVTAIPRRKETYQKALGVFQEGFAELGRKNWAPARERFETLLRDYAIESELCDRARVYLRACERAMGEPPAPPSDPETFYLHGVWHTNRGEVDEALSLFDRGLDMDPRSDKILYASAVALAGAGRTGEAMKRLGKAIEIDPQNRVLALNDPDFEPVRDEPEFIDLVEPEESRGA